MMLDTTEQRFAQDVIEASRESTVLVDFWAAWCGPCRSLAPLLAAIEKQHPGRLRIVKVDVDQNPQLAAEFGVRSIPHVIAFADGEAVDAFTGVLPAAELHRFVDRLLPDAAELERRKAAQLRQQGDLHGAVLALRAALALDPERDTVRLELAELLIEGTPDAASLEETAACLAGVSAAGKLESAYTALHTQLQSRHRAAELPGVDVLLQRLAAAPDDLQARLDLANLHIAQRRYEAALAQALAIVERDRAFGDDIGRRTMLAIFDLAAGEPQLVSSYRRRLATALNR